MQYEVPSGVISGRAVRPVDLRAVLTLFECRGVVFCAAIYENFLLIYRCAVLR